MDFVPENCFNLRHHKIVTLAAGRRRALNTSCSLATRATVSGDVNFPCYVVWRERRRLGLVFSCSATEKPSQITFAAPRRALAHGRPCSGANVFNLVIELGSRGDPQRVWSRQFTWRTTGAWPLA